MTKHNTTSEILAAIAPTPDLLYHTTLTITTSSTSPSHTPSTPVNAVSILGTFTSLPVAKSAALSALASEGYLKDDFETYEVKNALVEEREEGDEGNWKHGDGVLVYAKAPAGQEFEVRIETEENEGGFRGNEGGEVEGVLHYVLQTTINYNTDRTGSSQSTQVLGTYSTRQLARTAATTSLLSDEITKSSFAEYDEQSEFQGEWPYGDECLVHAVGETGENFFVFVKAQPKRRQREGHGKKCECNGVQKEEGGEGGKCMCKHGDCGCMMKH